MFIFNPEIHTLALAARADGVASDEKVVILDFTAPYEVNEDLGYNPFKVGYDGAGIKWEFELLDDDAVELSEIEIREADGEPWLALVVNENGDWSTRLGVVVKAA